MLRVTLPDGHPIGVAFRSKWFKRNANYAGVDSRAYPSLVTSCEVYALDNAQVPGNLIVCADVVWNPQDRCERRMGQKQALTKAIAYMRGQGYLDAEGSGLIWQRWLELKGEKRRCDSSKDALCTRQ